MSSAPEPIETIPSPDPETVESAVGVLQAELSLTDGHLDAIDRKAALLPPFLVLVAGLLLRDASWTIAESALNLAALFTGAVCVVYSLTVLRPGKVSVGPEASVVAHQTHLPPPAFHLRVAVSLADAVDLNTRRTKVKADRLRTAGWWAAGTMLLLILARIAGGLLVTDDNTAPAPSNAPVPSQGAAPSPSAPQSPGVSAPAQSPSPGPALPSGPTTTDTLPSFGQQLAERADSVLPSFGQQWAEKGGPLPPDTEKRVEKSG